MIGRPSIAREVEREFWRQVKAGSSVEAAARLAGVSTQTGQRRFRQAGGVIPADLSPGAGRYLSFAEREHIALGRAAGHSMRQIAAELGRAPSTVSRELARHPVAKWPCQYKASVAQARADRRARRPKLSKLALIDPLHRYVQDKLTCSQHWSPEQISRRLEQDFPDDVQMRISHESIYRSLYVQGRGELRRELTASLRTGRALRQPNRRPDRRLTRIRDMVNISERPAEVEDRAVPGHWEGDLIIGKDGKSAIGTLVERTTRFVMLLHLPGDRNAETVRAAIAAKIVTLPERLRRSLTWDQGIELAEHAQLKIDTDLDIYFCDPHSPWQRGTNENTNGLLRQYFPKGTNLSVHDEQALIEVGDALNGRPRKTLHWRTPAEAMDKLLSGSPNTGVASTP